MILSAISISAFVGHYTSGVSHVTLSQAYNTVAGIGMAVYLFIVAFRDDVLLRGHITSLGSAKYVMCMLASSIQFVVLGMGSFLGTIHFYSIYSVTKHWNVSVQYLMRSIKCMTILFLVKILLFLITTLSLEYVMEDSVYDVGFLCSVPLGKSTRATEIVINSYLLLLQLCGTISQMILAILITKVVSQSRKAVARFGSHGNASSKGDKLKRKLLLMFIPPNLLTLPLLYCWIASLLDYTLDDHQVFVITSIVFPLTFLYNGVLSLALKKRHIFDLFLSRKSRLKRTFTQKTMMFTDG